MWRRFSFSLITTVWCSLSLRSSLIYSGHGADSKEILYDFSPMIIVYKDGSFKRLQGLDIVSASYDPEHTGVHSKDVHISEKLGVSARLYLPRNAVPGRKFPVLVYYHGGGFFANSAFAATYHTHLKAVVAEANVVAISVEYRLSPEHPLPAAYEDAWLALKWVAFHSTGDGPEAWINEYADFDSVFLAGDSAGGNLAHNTALRFGLEKLDGINLDGIFLNCPYFWGKEPIGIEAKDPKGKAFVDLVSQYVYPTSTTKGPDDPLLNFLKEPKLASLGCRRVLVYVGGSDILKDRGLLYTEELEKIGWSGEVETVEVEGEEHIFNLLYPQDDKSLAMLKHFASFLNRSSTLLKLNETIQ